MTVYRIFKAFVFMYNTIINENQYVLSFVLTVFVAIKVVRGVTRVTAVLCYF